MGVVYKAQDTKLKREVRTLVASRVTLGVRVLSVNPCRLAGIGPISNLKAARFYWLESGGADAPPNPKQA